MFATVFAYYRVDWARPWFDRLGVLKQQGGYLFAAVAAMIAGGVLPEAFRICGIERRLPVWRDAGSVLFAMGFWTCNGLCVDLLYRWQTVWFGAEANAAALTKKVVIDQFAYNPVFAAPFAVACYRWKNQEFSFAGMEGIFTPRGYVHQVVPTLLANWMVWIPVVVAVYSLPPLLQIPLFSLAVCFWALMLACIHAKPETNV